VKDAGDAEGVDDAGGVTGVSDVGMNAGRYARQPKIAFLKKNQFPATRGGRWY